MSVIVIGHRNPDTDAICSAIAYADLLRRTGMPDAEAAACGPLNLRCKFVLQRAGLEAPLLIMDVRPTAGQLCQRNVLSARRHEPFLEVYRRMRRHHIREIPVLDDAGGLAGMLPLLNLLDVLIPDEQDMARHRVVHTSLTTVRDVLAGSFQHQVEPTRTEPLVMMIGAMKTDSFAARMHKFPAERILLVVGDRPSVQRRAIEYGVRCMVITGGHALSDDLLARAREKAVTILNSPLDTAMSALLIKSARAIDVAISQEFATVRDTLHLEELRDAVKDSPQNLFPVLDDTGAMVGVISKSDLVDPAMPRLILVDHNEYAQAVAGADSAEILQVIDHHRMGGGLITREPIRFMNEPVGSTCTIVTRMFREQALVPDRPIAICLASGIISDTLNLQSPTTTATDRDLLAWLGPHTGLDLDQYVHDLFTSGSSLSVDSTSEVLNTDCKAYTENDWAISVSQVEELGLDRFWERRTELEAALAASVREKKIDFACLLVTDITQQSSLLLTAGAEKIIRGIKYPRLEHNLFELAGVVSRKKQLLPHLMSILAATTRPAG